MTSKLQIGNVIYLYKTAFFLIVSMTCLYLKVTYIHITLEKRIPSYALLFVCLTNCVIQSNIKTTELVSQSI